MYYMTVDELKALMPSVFTSNELLGIGWCDYTPEDLEAILGRSEVFIDELKYKGQYKEKNQQHKCVIACFFCFHKIVYLETRIP